MHLKTFTECGNKVVSGRVSPAEKDTCCLSCLDLCIHLSYPLPSFFFFLPCQYSHSAFIPHEFFGCHDPDFFLSLSLVSRIKRRGDKGGQDRGGLRSNQKIKSMHSLTEERKKQTLEVKRVRARDKMRRAARNRTGLFGLAGQWTPVWRVSSICPRCPTSLLSHPSNLTRGCPEWRRITKQWERHPTTPLQPPLSDPRGVRIGYISPLHVEEWRPHSHREQLSDFCHAVIRLHDMSETKTTNRPNNCFFYLHIVKTTCGAPQTQSIVKETLIHLSITWYWTCSLSWCSWSLGKLNIVKVQ